MEDMSHADIYYTYEELELKALQEWENMHDEEKNTRIRNCDPTFIEQVLTSMKKNERVLLNEFTYKYEYIKI
jgi:hypothetical protein